jgi:hypothetical protein
MVPTRDVLLMPYSTNFNTRIVASASTYGLSAAQVTKFTGLYTPYIEAANAAAAEGQKNKSLVASRNSAKAALMPYFRELYAFIQANSDVADSAKVDLGIVIRRHPAPQPAVATAPIITVASATSSRATGTRSATSWASSTTSASRRASSGSWSGRS